MTIVGWEEGGTVRWVEPVDRCKGTVGVKEEGSLLYSSFRSRTRTPQEIGDNESRLISDQFDLD